MSGDEAMHTIWNYLRLQHTLKRADAIFVFCSNDTRVAEYAATLWHQNLAPIMIVSGDGTKHQSHLLKDTYSGKTEAEVFAKILIDAGVPEEKLLIEAKANNTAENFIFTQSLLKQRGLKIDSALVVQKPYMERRTFATGKVVWPELEQILTSPTLSFEEYCAGEIDRDTVINLMVGDLERIIEYPKKGWQIEQILPDQVLQAFKILVAAGYNKHLTIQSP